MQKPKYLTPDLFNKVADHIVSLDNLDGYNEQNISNLAWAYNKAGIIRQDLNNKLKDAADNRKEEFSRWNRNNLYHWTSEESTQIQEDDEQNVADDAEKVRNLDIIVSPLKDHCARAAVEHRLKQKV